jgi:serine/threonine protein phosphatase PrpC
MNKTNNIPATCTTRDTGDTHFYPKTITQLTLNSHMDMQKCNGSRRGCRPSWRWHLATSAALFFLGLPSGLYRLNPTTKSLHFFCVGHAQHDADDESGHDGVGVINNNNNNKVSLLGTVQDHYMEWAKRFYGYKNNLVQQLQYKFAAHPHPTRTSKRVSHLDEEELQVPKETFFPDLKVLTTHFWSNKEGDRSSKQYHEQKTLSASLGSYRYAVSAEEEERDEDALEILQNKCMARDPHKKEYMGISAGGNQQDASADPDDCASMERIPEPFAGMVLQVKGSTNQELETQPGDAERRYGGSEHRDVVQYELTERVYGELGRFDKHVLDYAYNPVIHNFPTAAENNGGESDSTPDKDSSLSTKGDRGITLPENLFPSKDGKNGIVERLPSWLSNAIRGHVQRDTQGSLEYPMPQSLADLYNNRDNHERLYERMGETAFAGGSHGEIWKARRRCNWLAKAEHKARPGRQQHCDESEVLIMKRLRVEQGARFLEAGLREVYFGKLIMQEKNVQDPNELFTAYVDHFFRASPSLRGNIGDQLTPQYGELWIVFKRAGPSLRSFLYTPVDVGGFLVYQNSDFWRKLRQSVTKKHKRSQRDAAQDVSLVSRNAESTPKGTATLMASEESGARKKGEPEGRTLMKEVLRQLLTSVAALGELGVVHRDIKPSNIMCDYNPDSSPVEVDPLLQSVVSKNSSFTCVLGDFSSGWDEFTNANLYSDGPSVLEQTNEYAPPEALGGQYWKPFDHRCPQSYDSWSIGVVALEMLLGTPNVFSVDQRTTALLTHRLKRKGATENEIQKALYLAALSQFCIYVPSDQAWPFNEGDPLHMSSVSTPTCTLHDFHTALRARDPLGLGFDSSANPLLGLISRLLAWNPADRITPEQALLHSYFTGEEEEKRENPTTSSLEMKGDSSLMSHEESHHNHGSSLPTNLFMPQEFECPKCNRKFDNWHSCLVHANSRRHARFCDYDASSLPPCLSTHSMLPAHPSSGYCDIQGRRPTIEDFHSIQLLPSHQFYGVFDGHLGNLASKFAASKLHESITAKFAGIDKAVQAGEESSDWRIVVNSTFVESFDILHQQFLEVAAASPGGVMDQSGTTATVLYVTSEAILVANVGDSRAVLSIQGSSGPMKPLELTVDHTPVLKEERQRIEMLGGHVAANGGIDRVNGVLAISRSIGDSGLAHLLSRVPHVVSYTRAEILNMCHSFDADENTPIAPIDDAIRIPCFIVLASDGLWDVVSNQEAVDMVTEVYRHSSERNMKVKWDDGGSFQEAARRLTHEAYTRGSTDNIGVCVVAID